MPNPALEAAAAADYAIPNGHFYTQTGGGAGKGYGVVDDSAAAFWSEFQRLGGVEALGFPVSRRFMWNGFVSQAMQRVVFQWRPDTKQVAFVNVFDLMTESGRDDWLLAVRQVPRPLPATFDSGKPWAEVVAGRLALLDENPALRAQYFSAPDPVTMNGLPTSRVTDMGNNYTVRCQRVVIQQWKHDVPWAQAGQVTVALGGDIAKEARLLPSSALPPEPGSLSALLDGDHPLIPVNKQRALPSDYEPSDLSPISSVQVTQPGIMLRHEALAQLQAMDAAARGAGIDIIVASAYRSYQQQAQLYQYYVDQNGEAAANRFSAKPGHSEHQLGATVDLTSASSSYQLTDGYGGTPEGKWVAQNAYRFGFVMSYPKGKEAITGYVYEPWHFRYVGIPAAAEIRAQGVTSHEYLEARWAERSAGQ